MRVDESKMVLAGAAMAEALGTNEPTMDPGVSGLVLVLVFLVFWVWMLAHCLTNPRLQGTEKLAWVLVIIFFQIVGALVYFFVGRTKRA